MKGHVCALVGAQYGSEGKGAIADDLAWDYGIHVRTGAPNAGHTIIHEGTAWKMRSVPCGWVNPDAWLVIGAGALIDPQLLFDEIDALESQGYEITSRLVIDRKAQILLPAYHQYEGGVNGAAHQAIGSTGEGVGPARMAKIARNTIPVHPFRWFSQAGDWGDFRDRGLQLIDTVAFLQNWISRGESVLLEGTQGSGLSLTHGVWPYCTSTDTNAAQLCADAGIPPQRVERVVLVARTFPIRVAGNSGPLQGETTWEEIGVPPEQTTVTGKTRRVGVWDPDLVIRAVMLNGATEIALTFLDYVCHNPDVELWSDLHPMQRDWIRTVEDQTGVPVSMVGVGPDTVVRAPHRASVIA